MAGDIKIVKPQRGFQDRFSRTSVDICFGGGNLAAGKSFGAVLACAEPSLDPRFNALFLRNNLDDAKASGGLLDKFEECYGDSIKIVRSGNPYIEFPSGAKVEVTHVADQDPKVLDKRFKGREYDLIYFDEGTGFTWECFTTIISRNRGHSNYAGRVLLSTNPEREHWIRKFIDWYVGADGRIDPSRDGVVRYLYMLGSRVEDIVWGQSKEEVYRICSHDINLKLNNSFPNWQNTNPNMWQSMIKSFTFYTGRMSENKAMLQGNENYIGSVALGGGAEASKKLEGNWNASEDDDNDMPITRSDAESVFFNEPQTNGDRWITADLADNGTDNFIALAWNGFHAYDIKIIGKSTPRQNAEELHIFAVKHDIADSHIIFDAIRAVYVNDYIPDAVPFFSYNIPRGLYKRSFLKLKDECYMRLCIVINNKMLSFSEELKNTIYKHQKIKEPITVQSEFIDETGVVMFKDSTNGKKTLLTKKEMNQKLGKGRSMDLLDPCAMRMLPVLEYEYGSELISTFKHEQYDADEEERTGNGVVNIFEEASWI